MKKILLILTLAVFGFSVIAQNGSIVLRSNGSKAKVTKDSFSGFNATFAFDKIESEQRITEKGTFSEIMIDGTFPSGSYGHPSLPVARQMISIPQGATPKVNVLNYTETVYSLEDFDIQTLYPQQPSVRKDMRPEEVKFVYDEKAYARRGYDERPIAEVEVLGNMRAARIGTITINPVVYDASTNTIKVRNNVEVEVVFENADKAKTDYLYAQTTNPYFATIYNKFFNKSVYDDHPDLYTTPVRMLVISHRMFEETLQPWIEWKTEKGFYMDVNYTDQIGTTYNQIRDFVHNKYNTGVANGTAPTFVILVGDVAQVPNTIGSSSQKVTDLYYSSVDGDYFPEMFCSRMSAETTAQLEAIIEKTLVYEKYTMADPSYLNNVLLIAGQDYYWNPKIGQPTIKYATQYYFNAQNGFNNVNTYLSSPYTGCYNSLSTGVAFANYTAHGSETSWADPSFTNNNVNQLTNVDKYFLAMGNCCITANFGYSQPCFGEAMTRASKKGAYAYIGSAPNSYWNEDYYFGVGATNVHGGTVPTLENSTMGTYDAMFMEDAYNTVAAVLFSGNLAVTHAHSGGYQTHSTPTYYWQAYHVFGDGSVMPYLSEPSQNVVQHAPAFPIGQSTFNVKADAGSYVAISKGGVLYGTAVVPASGSVDVVLDTPITTGGKVLIVVTAPQRIPYIKEIDAASIEDAYIGMSSENPTVLDGDGILSYNETTGLTLNMKNIGAQATSGKVNVTIATDNPNVTINTATVSTTGPVAANQAFTLSGFKFTTSKNVENDEKINFTFTASDNNDSWEGSFSFVAKKPIIEYVNHNWNGSFSANSEQEITVNFKNKGGFAISNASVALTTTTSNVTITNISNSLGNIAVDGTKSAKFKVAFGNVAVDQPITFKATVTGDAGAYTSVSEFTLANQCDLTFKLEDSYGDGWNNAQLTVSFNDGTAPVTMTVPSDTNVYEQVITVKSGTEVTLTWKKGFYDDECSFIITNNTGDVLYQHNAGEGLDNGVLATFINDCGSNPNPDPECNPVTNLTAVNEGSDVILNWDAPAAKRTKEVKTFSFDNDLEGWTNIDKDGDGHLWYHSSEASNHGTMAITSHSGAGHIMGESYCNAGGALNPDNYFVAPEKYTIDNGSSISFWVCAQDANYPSEHFGVAVSTTGNTNASDFTTIKEWTLTPSGSKVVDKAATRGENGKASGVWYQVTCDLSAYAGQSIWIAIRHFNVSDQFIICLDDVEITTEGDAPIGYTYTVERDGVDIATGLTTTTYTDQDVEEGEFDYCVKAVYSDCTSTPACLTIEDIYDMGTVSGLRIYPNPAIDILNVQGENIKDVVLYNSLGQTVKVGMVNNQINVSNLSNGVYYLVVVSNDSKRAVEKIVIAK